MDCEHRNEFGSYDFHIEDERCSTDRGTMGSILCICNICDADITELVTEQKDRYEED